MNCIGLYNTKSIRRVITDKETGKCKYMILYHMILYHEIWYNIISYDILSYNFVFHDINIWYCVKPCHAIWYFDVRDN